jgi:enamine deaminase RidA (YjgF/YER057c/UK114 family)
MPKREIIRPRGVPVPHPTFTPAIRFGRWVFASGAIATNFKHGLAPEVAGSPGVPLAGEHRIVREADYIFRILRRTLRAAGTDFANAVRIAQFPTTREAVDPYHIVRRDVIKPPRPASTSVVISGLMVPAASIEVEMVAILPEESFRKEGITSDRIPQPLGGYTPAIRAGDFVFVAGQVPSDFKTGLAPEARVNPNFWEGNAIDREARYVLDNLRTTLEAAGSSLDNVVKAEVYLTDLNDIPRLDRVWREYFPVDPPARLIMPVGSIVLPDGHIEVTLVAVTDGGKTKKQVIRTDKAPSPLFHESQAVRAGELLFLSGQLATDENGLVAAARVDPDLPYRINGPAAQMQAIMDHAEAICAAAGTSLSQGLRMLTMHTDLHEYPASVEVRRRSFPDGQPATTTIAVPGPLQVPGCTIAADLWVGVP